MWYFCIIDRYCKGISETEEKELRIFAASRKQESLGKGMVVKYVSNKESNEVGTRTDVTNVPYNTSNSSSCAEVYRFLHFSLTLSKTIFS